MRCHRGDSVGPSSSVLGESSPSVPRDSTGRALSWFAEAERLRDLEMAMSAVSRVTLVPETVPGQAIWWLAQSKFPPPGPKALP